MLPTYKKIIPKISIVITAKTNTSARLIRHANVGDIIDIYMNMGINRAVIVNRTTNKSIKIYLKNLEARLDSLRYDIISGAESIDRNSSRHSDNSMPHISYLSYVAPLNVEHDFSQFTASEMIQP